MHVRIYIYFLQGHPNMAAFSVKHVQLLEFKFIFSGEKKKRRKKETYYPWGRSNVWGINKNSLFLATFYFLSPWKWKLRFGFVCKRIYSMVYEQGRIIKCHQNVVWIKSSPRLYCCLQSNQVNSKSFNKFIIQNRIRYEISASADFFNLMLMYSKQFYPLKDVSIWPNTEELSWIIHCSLHMQEYKLM